MKQIISDLRNEQGIQTMKLLLADDSGTMRTIQKRCLLKLGLAETDITEAEDGQQALTQFESANFDVVLSDWNMPNMDGLTFLQKVRETNKDVPFIMITTEAERARVVTAIQAGVTDYLVKPFTPDDLRAKLEKWVARLSRIVCLLKRIESIGKRPQRLLLGGAANPCNAGFS